LLLTLATLLAPLAALAEGPQTTVADEEEPFTLDRAGELKVKVNLGLLPSPPGDYPRAEFKPSLEALPNAADLSAKMPLIGNQGSQGSCVGWATAYYLRSYQEGVEANRLPRLTSELFSPAYIYNQRATANRTVDGGMTMIDALRIATSQGVSTLATMPYNQRDWQTQPSAAARAEAARYLSASYQNVFIGQGRANLEAIKQRLATGEAVLLAVPVYSEFFRVTSTNAVIDIPASGSAFYGGHAILAVGYDNATRRVKFVNSWGAGWGQGGYAYLTYAFVQQKAWEAWLLIDRDTTPPAMATSAVDKRGSQNNVVQSRVNNPSFAWSPSNEAGVVYQLYWGTDAAGTGTITTTIPAFSPTPVSQTSTLYLRGRAIDRAGNASTWRTLYTFRYQRR
jgi:hypothetical protein